MPRLLSTLLLCLLAPAAGATAPASAAAVAADAAAARAAHRARLVEGVETIASPGNPGEIVAFGVEALPVVLGAKGDGLAATVAAAPLGRGRIVALSHNGYAGRGALDAGDTRRFLENAIRWSAGEQPRRRADQPLRVALRRAADLATLLDGDSFRAVAVDGGDWIDSLAEVDVLLTFDADCSEEEAASLARFVREGGGLVVGVCPWGWEQVRRSTLDRNRVQRLLQDAGLAWTSDIVAPTYDGRFAIDAAPTPLHHGAAALAALESHAEGAAPLDKASLATASATAVAAIRSLPPGDRALGPTVDRLLRGRAEDLVPSEARPLGADRALDRVLLAAQIQAIERQPASRIDPHPAAAAFPGAVPSGARRVTRVQEIDLARPQWHSTGLYAPPGETIAIEIPSELADEGLAVRIGCHTDLLWHHDAWRRVPVIASRHPLESQRTTIASAFGGLVYIDVPQRLSGSAAVRIAGAVESPRFVLGETTPEAWRRAREAPGPWGELETDRVIVSVPSSALREIDDPTALLETWNAILDACADLAAIPRKRLRPERYVADVQISAGYMHSGYPIMTHLDAAADMTSRERLLAGSWGLFHEMGHNHQDGMWTFDGTVEVTCNLFSLYVCETVCGLPVNAGHDALGDRERRIAAFRAPDRRGRGPSFERWKADPFLALIMYQQLREAFGWEAYQRVFAEYRDLPPEQRPRDEQAKRDQWMVRFSKAVGRNLAPFFDFWCVPVSEEARRAVEGLPVWEGAG